MTFQLSIMNTAFHTPIGVYRLESRLQMLADLGIGGYYHACFEPREEAYAAELAAQSARTGVQIAGLSFSIDLSGTQPAWSLERAVERLVRVEATRRIELALGYRDGSVPCSDPTGDAAALRALERLLPLAERHDLILGLYPHCHDWLERFSDGLRLAARLNHPRLGCVFCGFHWYFRDDRSLTRLHQQFQQAQRTAGRIVGANLNGSTSHVEQGGRPTIEPLGQGDLDNFALLTCLHDVGYSGWIDAQGYSVGGDVYARLRQTRDAFNDMTRRLDSHPAWGRVWQAPA